MTHAVRPGEWIRLESIETPDERSKVNDISVIFRVSPYDIPEAIRASHDAESGRIRIELRYLGDEATEARALQHGAVLHVGKKSGRLYGVELPAAGRVGRCEVRFETERVREALADARPDFRRPRNLELAGRAISAHLPDLVEAFGM